LKERIAQVVFRILLFTFAFTGSCPEGGPASSSDVIQPQPIQVIKAPEKLPDHLPDDVPHPLLLDISCSSLNTQLAQIKRQPSHEHAKVLVVQNQRPCNGM